MQGMSASRKNERPVLHRDRRATGQVEGKPTKGLASVNGWLRRHRASFLRTVVFAGGLAYLY